MKKQQISNYIYLIYLILSKKIMWIIKTGIIFSLISIILGAFGTHALENIIADKIEVFKTGVQYQIFHALGLILIGILSKTFSVNLNKVAYLIIAGIILFTGSLYLISIFKTTSIGIITPIGGTLFIIGWSVLLFRLSNI